MSPSLSDRDAVAAMSQLYYRQADNSSYRDRIPLRVVRAEAELSALERAYLGAVEKGDYASVKQALEEAEIYFRININCIDPLGRTALLIAIDNENLEIIELLLSYNVYVGDALLHAIRKEVVGAVELLLNHKKPRGEKQVLEMSDYILFTVHIPTGVCLTDLLPTVFISFALQDIVENK